MLEKPVCVTGGLWDVISRLLGVSESECHWVYNHSCFLLTTCKKVLSPRAYIVLNVQMHICAYYQMFSHKVCGNVLFLLSADPLFGRPG